MDLPVELIFFLILIVANAIAGVFGGKKKGGPKGTTLPPVERKRPAPDRQRPARETGPARRPSGARIERPDTGGRSSKPREDPAWWDSDAPAVSAPLPSAQAPRAETPWWEADPTEASPEPAAADPWRDDAGRPAGAVLRSPEELWEILTGERLGLPGAEPGPPPTAPGPTQRGGGVERARNVADASARYGGGRTRPPGYDDPRSPRPDPAGDTDVVTLEGRSLEGLSLEETEISSERRHEEFHRKIARVPVVARRQPALERLGLHSRGDIRRAVILAEVLGSPRSLSEPDR
jgi:hypothetical protein